MAYNEERNIAGMLGSLCRQTLLNAPGHSISIHVLPNGCRDATAARAREALDALMRDHPAVSVEVNEIAEAGKANAWNRFVHDFSSRDAEALLFLDGDITFGEPECIEHVVQALEQHPEAVVAVDLPLKDITAKSSLSVRERVSLSASRAQTAGPPKIAGSLYLARAAAVRAFWLPLGLIVEDGFVKAMLLTNCFREPENLLRIVRAPNATHLFEAATEFQAWFKHERRLVNGTAVNLLLFELLHGLARQGADTGEYVRDRNRANPAWVSELARNYRGALPGARAFVIRPLEQLGNLPTGAALKAFPIALLRAVLNIAVCIVCQFDVRAGRLRW